MGKNNTSCCRGQRGSALVYILIAIALLGALTVSFMDNSSNQTTSQNTFKAVSELQTQIDFVRSAVQECILLHQGGDITITNDAAGDDPGASKFYPIKPSSAHFTGADIGPTVGTDLVKDIRCPGNPGDDQNHEPVFGGRSGKFLPPIPGLFEDWQWYNGTDGIFFWTETDRSDAFIDTVFERLNAEYSACEADIIDATSAAVTMDSNTTISCPSGSKCFRVWIVADGTNGVGNVEDGLADPNVAVFPSEVGCP